MCNINAWFPKKRITYKQLDKFWRYSEESNETNQDGFGLWTDNGIWKWESNKLPSIFSIKSLQKADYIITHQRLSTSGKTKSMIHPYVFKLHGRTLIGIHNGIITFSDKELDHVNYSDSFHFFSMLTKAIDKHTGDITAAMQETLNNIYASSSLSILFSVEDVDGMIGFYYYRRNRSINLYDFNGLYFSTSSRKGLTKHKQQPEANCLYAIDQDYGKLYLMKDFNPPPATTTNYPEAYAEAFTRLRKRKFFTKQEDAAFAKFYAGHIAVRSPMLTAMQNVGLELVAAFLQETEEVIQGSMEESRFDISDIPPHLYDSSDDISSCYGNLTNKLIWH